MKNHPFYPIQDAPTGQDLNASESKLQSEMFLWAWNTYPQYRRMLFHINNKARNAVEGNKFKAMGVVRGPSDLALLAPGGRTIWIEVKVPEIGELQAAEFGIAPRAEGKQSEEQEDFQRKAEAWGHTYVIVERMEEFQEVVKEYWGAPVSFGRV